MKILIAYDGSQCADAMLDYLQHAGLPEQTEALVLTVAELGLIVPAYPMTGIVVPSHIQRDEEEAASLAARAGQLLHNNFPAWKITTEEVLGSPARRILERAEQWQPDIIALGSHGRSALGRLFLGSVSQQVISHAYHSVLIGRKREITHGGPARIVLGVDGSPHAYKAAQAIAERRWPQGTTCRIVTATGPVSLTDANLGLMLRLLKIEDAEQYRKVELEHAQEAQKAAAALLGAGELKVEKVIKEGHAKDLLLAEAEVGNADAIFLGSLGLTRLERFVVGSVSLAVATRAHCSVEIIH